MADLRHNRTHERSIGRIARSSCRSSARLGAAYILLASHSASLQRGYRWTAGPRDEPLQPLTGIAGRLARANANFLETFPFFAAAILAVLATGAHSPWSNWGVILYISGRIAYLPLYAFGVVLSSLLGLERGYCWDRCNLCRTLCVAPLMPPNHWMHLREWVHARKAREPWRDVQIEQGSRLSPELAWVVSGTGGVTPNRSLEQTHQTVIKFACANLPLPMRG